MAAQTYPLVSSKVGEYNFGEWASIYNARFDEGYLSEIDRYGLGSYFTDFMMLADRRTSVTNRSPKLFERLEWETTVKTGTQINTGAAGADISFTVDASDVDASGNLPVMEGEGLVIPAAFEATNENRIYVISDITGTTVTAGPLSADGTTQTESEIAVAVPSGTVLKVHSYYTGYGTGQPPGHNSVRAQREYNTQIIKTSMNYEGGIQAIKWRQIKTESGVNSVWIEGQELAESFHSKRMDDAIFLGELNDNSTLTEASQFGGTNKRTATKGLWNWAEEAGQELLYPGVFDFTQFYDYKDLIISQNVVARDIMFLYGTDLGRMVEEAGLDWLKSYSGGSSLFRTADEIGINIKYTMLNGFMFMFKELKSFSNPLRYGNKAYEFSKYGLMIPDQTESVTIDGRTERHSNITLGFLNWAGEDRTRIVRVVDGMSGRMSMAVNDYDGSNLWMLTEFVPIVTRPNQLVQVKPQ
jgi:hypothetical protein